MKSIRARAPSASSAIVRRVMQANPSRDTTPETLVRSSLHRAGLRFRKDTRPLKALKCNADVVFFRSRVCVFVDGCFWHGCPRHFKPPRTHTAWWREKIQDNVRRDRRQTEQLRKAGWQVIRIWEHDVKGRGLTRILGRIAMSVRRRTAQQTGSRAAPKTPERRRRRVPMARPKA